jgi:predicted transposase/invertase (TIGR01784 family)
MSANIKFKDSLFRSLFSKPEPLRQLYSALTGVTIPEDVPITINTLEDVLFMGRKNDISFLIGDALVVLFEHQSTINPNMPLRMLDYIVPIYEKIIDERDRYSETPLELPRPVFFLLYNGEKSLPAITTLKLSDLFKEASVFLSPEMQTLSLELVVTVININSEENAELLEKCTLLKAYVIFVRKVREYKKQTGSLEEGIKLAIKYCCENDILKEYLEEHSVEVTNMLTIEWNQETALAVRFEDGKKEGKEEVARNALAEGASFEFVQRITGLGIETIKKLRS